MKDFKYIAGVIGALEAVFVGGCSLVVVFFSWREGLISLLLGVSVGIWAVPGALLAWWGLRKT